MERHAPSPETESGSGFSVYVGVRLPADLAHQLHRLAADEHNGISSTVRRVLSHGLKNLDGEPGGGKETEGAR